MQQEADAQEVHVLLQAIGQQYDEHVVQQASAVQLQDAKEEASPAERSVEESSPEEKSSLRRVQSDIREQSLDRHCRGRAQRSQAEEDKQ